MKHIDADKLIAEIERLIKEHKKALSKEDNTLIVEAMLKGSLNAYEYIKHFLSSLQQEQPEVDEPEYGPYARQYPKSKVSQEQPEVDIIKEVQDLELQHRIDGSIYDFARHFYELGLNARGK